MITTRNVRRIEDELARLQARVRETASRRDRNAHRRTEWEEARRAFRSYMTQVGMLEHPAVLVKIRAGEQPWLEAAFRFLEADPWFFRSGYIKGKLARAFKKVPFNARELNRVRYVLLARVLGHDRSEFKEYCRLAAKVANSGLRSELERALKKGDDRVRWRARTMLEYIDRHGAHGMEKAS
jgi:hypothetical protein